MNVLSPAADLSLARNRGGQDPDFADGDVMEATGIEPVTTLPWLALTIPRAPKPPLEPLPEFSLSFGEPARDGTPPSNST